MRSTNKGGRIEASGADQREEFPNLTENEILEVEAPKKRHIFQVLPTELIVEITLFVSLKEVYSNIICVNEIFHKLIKSNKFARIIGELHYGRLFKSFSKRLLKSPKHNLQNAPMSEDSFVDELAQDRSISERCYQQGHVKLYVASSDPELVLAELVELFREYGDFDSCGGCEVKVQEHIFRQEFRYPREEKGK